MHGIDRIGEIILVLPVILILYLHYTAFLSKAILNILAQRPLLPTLKTTLPIPKKYTSTTFVNCANLEEKNICVKK